jgi:imidazoleglycerol-phosphate dehydratase
MAKRKSVPAPRRPAEVKRRTRETAIRARVAPDGRGQARVASGIGFFDHMLEALAKHAAFDLELECRGDRHVDDHHSVEDAGIVLGQALAKALGDKAGIRRFGFASVPLDEALAQVTVDLSGRGQLILRGRERLGRGKVGAFDIELTEDFLAAFAGALGATIHVEIRSGRNAHHIIEAVFKALARALRQAVEPDARIRGIPSTKGLL